MYLHVHCQSHWRDQESIVEESGCNDPNQSNASSAIADEIEEAGAVVKYVIGGISW